VGDLGDSVVFAPVVSDDAHAQLLLAAFALSASHDAQGLHLIATVPLARTASMFDAYQSVAASPSMATASSGEPGSALVFASLHDAVVLVTASANPVPSVSVQRLVRGTFAATFISPSHAEATTVGLGGRGILASTAVDTTYQEAPPWFNDKQNKDSPLPPALVWPEPGVFRATKSAVWAYLALFTHTSRPGKTFRTVLIPAR